MKFKVGDKVRLKYIDLFSNLKIRDGIITKIFNNFIRVKRGKTEDLWNPIFWKKVR